MSEMVNRGAHQLLLEGVTSERCLRPCRGLEGKSEMTDSALPGVREER